MSMISDLRNRLASMLATNKGQLIVGGRSRSTGDYEGMRFHLSKRATEFGWDDQGLAYASSASVWAWRCIWQRAKAIDSLDWYVTLKGSDVRVSNSAWENALKWAYLEFQQNLMFNWQMSYAIWGVNYFEKLYVGNTTTPGGLHWVNPINVEPQIMRGEITEYLYTTDSGMYKVPTDMLFRSVYVSPLSGIHGLPPMAQALNAININRKQSAYIQAFYDNDASPGGLISARQGYELDEEAGERLIAQWNAQFKGSDKSFRVGLLPAPLEYQPFGNKIPPEHNALSEEDRREICGALHVPMSMVDAGGVSDPLSAGSTMDKQTANFYEGFVIPEANENCKFANAVIFPWLDDRYELKVNTDKVLSLIKSTNEYSTMINNQSTAGHITVNEARKEQGYDELKGWDVIYVPSGSIPVPADKYDELMTIGRPIAQPFMSFNGIQSVDDLKQAQGQLNIDPARTPLLTSGKAVKASTGTPSGAILLKFDNPSLASYASDELRRHLNIESKRVRWNNPHTFHITLLHSPLIDDSEYAEIYNAIAGDFNPIPVQINGVGVFSNDIDALHFTIEMTAELSVLQSAIYREALIRRLPLSEYSDPTQWTPHITLAYMEAGTITEPLPAIKPITLIADRLVFSRDDFVQVYGVDNWTSDPMQVKGVVDDDRVKDMDYTTDAIYGELGAWSRWERKQFGKHTRDFDVKAIPPDLADDIKAELLEAESPDHIAEIFRYARKSIADRENFVAGVVSSIKASKITESDLERAMAIFDEVGLEDLKGSTEGLLDKPENEDDE